MKQQRWLWTVDSPKKLRAQYDAMWQADQRSRERARINAKSMSNAQKANDAARQELQSLQDSRLLQADKMSDEKLRELDGKIEEAGRRTTDTQEIVRQKQQKLSDDIIGNEKRQKKLEQMANLQSKITESNMKAENADTRLKEADKAIEQRRQADQVRAFEQVRCTRTGPGKITRAS